MTEEIQLISQGVRLPLDKNHTIQFRNGYHIRFDGVNAWQTDYG